MRIRNTACLLAALPALAIFAQEYSADELARSHGANILANAGFEFFDDSTRAPDNWNVGGEGRVQVAPAKSGEGNLLEVQIGSDDDRVVVGQRFYGEFRPGDLLLFTADVVVGISDTAFIGYRARSAEDGESAYVVAEHSGGGKRPLEALYRVQEGLEYVELRMVVAKPTKNPVEFSNLRATVMPVIP